MKVLQHRRLGAYQDTQTVTPGALPIAGTLARYSSPTNVPVSRRLYLLRETDFLAVRTSVSSVAGAYAFAPVDPRYTYTILAYDQTGTYRAAVANGIQAGAVAP